MTPVSIVIPVYNEEQALQDNLSRLFSMLQKESITSEIIAVDDGSTDGSLHVLKNFAGIKVLHHNANRGYGASIKTGIMSATFENILITDADGTYPVEDIPRLLSEMEQNDMVVGSRNGKVVHQSLLKKIAKAPIHWLANYLVGFKIPDLNSGLRVFRKDLAKKYFKLLPNGFSLTSNITLAFLSDGYRVKYLPINYYKRVGLSKVKPFSDAMNYLTLVVRMILFYNPLKIFIPLSILFFLASIAAFIYDIVVLENFGEKSIIFFSAFVQILILGLLADLINKRTSE